MSCATSRAIRLVVPVLLAVALAGCETTGGSISPSTASPRTSMIGETRTSTSSDGVVQTMTRAADGGFSFAIHSADAGTGPAWRGSLPMAYAGRWEISSSFGKSCALSLGTAPSGTGYEAKKAGFCTGGFDTIAVWAMSGSQLLLLDAAGHVRGRLSPDGHDAFAGTFEDGVFAPEAVKLRR